MDALLETLFRGVISALRPLARAAIWRCLEFGIHMPGFVGHIAPSPVSIADGAARTRPGSDFGKPANPGMPVEDVLATVTTTRRKPLNIADVVPGLHHLSDLARSFPAHLYWYSLRQRCIMTAKYLQARHSTSGRE